MVHVNNNSLQADL